MNKQVATALSNLGAALNGPIGKSAVYTEELAAAFGLNETKEEATKTTRPATKKASSITRTNERLFNPYTLYAKSPESLARKLNKTTAAALHQLIKEYVLDIGGKTKRWTNPTALAEFITAIVESRATKGDVYLSL